MSQNNNAQNANQLQSMFPDMSQSICFAALVINEGDVDKAVDEMLTFTHQKNEGAQISDVEKEYKERCKRKLQEIEKVNKEEQSNNTNSNTNNSINSNVSSNCTNDAVTAEIRAQIEREVKAELEQEIRQELQKELAKKQKVEQQKEQLNTPKVILYVDSFTNTQTTDEIQKIRSFLAAVDVADCDISSYLIAQDFELKAWLKSKLNVQTLSFPVICIHRQPVGTFENLKKLKMEEKLERLLNGDANVLVEPTKKFNDGTGEIVGQGIFDKSIDAVEYVGSTVSSIIWSPVTVTKWLIGAGESQPQKDANDVDFLITHTNWYSRNLQRIFRFKDTKFQRLHPDYKDVRAERDYDNVASIEFSEPKKFLIIKYVSGDADHITANTTDCEAIIKLIVARSTKKVPLVKLAK